MKATIKQLLKFKLSDKRFADVTRQLAILKNRGEARQVKAKYKQK